MTRYRSKKDSSIEAHVDSVSEKYGTTMLVYDTGEKTGTAFSISNSTLKRWWHKIDETNPVDALSIDENKVNEPYPEPKEQKYVPVPESVKEFESVSKGGRKHRDSLNTNIPAFETITKDLEQYIQKINERSSYVMLVDKVTTIWRKAGRISIYTNDKFATELSNLGLIASLNKDKRRPFAFEINTEDEWSKVESSVKYAINKEDK